MSTPAETPVELDPREKPGGGRLNPVAHVVRIVVVPRAHGSRSASQNDGHDQSHGLPDGELKAAEDKLKEMEAPPSPDGPSARLGSSAAAVPKPKNMFEALKPTDIVVVGREPASVRKVDSSGKPVSANPTAEAGQTASEPKPTLRLFAHDHHHSDTVLRVWTESDTIEYQCDQKFEIVKVEQAGWRIYGAPVNLFEARGGRTPYKAREEKTTDASGNLKSVWKWTSGVVPASANNQQYKMSFKIFDKNGENGEEVDPDIVCGDPPPVPGP